MSSPIALAFAAAALLLLAPAARAQVVGERHLTAHSEAAALRDAQHRDEVRVTVWYPAADGAQEERIDIGQPGKPVFEIGAVAPDAAFVDSARRPVILLSHGFGGTARVMAWFGLAMARAGYVVIAVDHPGNNGLDAMTAAGAVLPWRRADDLRVAMDRVLREPTIAPHVDTDRLGAAGFSAGGYTALLLAGARAAPDRLDAFCRRNPGDGICLPQKEYALPADEARAAISSPPLASEVAHAGDDWSIPQVKAAFVMAPALIQGLTPRSLERLRVPVGMVLGDADPVAPPATNGLVAAKAMPGARLRVLPGVGHYEFLARCTDEGRKWAPPCAGITSQAPAHDAAITSALDLFRRTLGDPNLLGTQARGSGG